MTALDTHYPVEASRPPNTSSSVGPARADVIVAIVDHAGQTLGIESFLPRRWITRRYQTIYEINGPDLLVLGSATPFLVATTRLLHSQATIVALIGVDAEPRLLVDLLHSGADVCVREGALPILAAHLMANHRRRVRRLRVTRRASV